MKALSLSQPMAWAVFNGKAIENRNWNTKYRGRVIIHAAKSFNWEHYNWLAENDNRLNLSSPLPSFRSEFVSGALIGEVDILDCVQDHTSLWFFGKYGFVLANAKLYSKPIPCKGKLNFFEPDCEIAARRCSQEVMELV